MKNFSQTSIQDITIDIKYKSSTPYTNYTLTHGLRKVHDGLVFGMTEKVLETLNTYGLFETETISKAQRQRYNRVLKSKGFTDEIMIEHMISVKTLVQGLWALKPNLSDNFEMATSQIREYLETNTDCIIKLKNQEKELHG